MHRRPVLYVRSPRHPALDSVVRALWYSERPARPGLRERVLPTGTCHLAFWLSPEPLRFYADEADERGRIGGHAVIGGPRASAYVRDLSQPGASVGVQLVSGAAARLFRVPAWDLADRHVLLADLWGKDASRVREQLAHGADPDAKLDALEALLVERLPDRPLHPVVAHAVRRLDEGADVRTVVDECGYSHRYVTALFHEAVGLRPKSYGRVARFQRALALRRATESWAEVAFAAGYSDQAHLSREFRAIAGLTPGQYLVRAPESPNHVPLD